MHPQRVRLHNELHARPSIYFGAPAHLHHYTFLNADGESEAILTKLGEVVGAAINRQKKQEILSFDGLILKWELHTEFFTLTFLVPERDVESFWPATPESLATIIGKNQSQLISATVILVESSEDWAGGVEAYGFRDPAGSHVGGGDATVWSDFRLTPEGVNRFLLVNHNLNDFRLGRMARRLLEIETYRMMASLSLPLAQDLGKELQDFERELGNLSDFNAEQQQENPRPLLAEISSLAARLERSGVRSRQRFSATEAYANIVFSRIEELRETRVGSSQRLGVFLLRRFHPTVRYCKAINRRQERLADSMARLNDLLRTRAQVDIEEQNTHMLCSLNERTRSQLKIQKAVEGLSIIVISYYVISLFQLGLASLKALGMTIVPMVAASVLGPVGLCVIGVMAWRIQRVKKY